MGLEQLGAMLFRGGGGGGSQSTGDAQYLKYYYDMLAKQNERDYAQQQADSIAALVDQMYGQQAQPQQLEEMGPYAGPPQMLPATEGSGLLGMEGLSPIQRVMLEREKAMMGSGVAQLQEAALEDQDIMMKNLVPGQMTPSTAGKMAAEAGLTPGSPEYQAFIRRYAFKPTGTTVKFGGQDRINVTDAKNMIYPDGSQVQPGTTWEEINARGGQLKTTLPAETAGKAAMVNVALEQTSGIRDSLYRPDGSLNKDVINAMSFMTTVPGGQAGHALAGQVAGVVYSPEVMNQAKALANKYEFGMQAITRTETGAAMPPEEVQNTRIRFQPFSGDTPQVVNQKLVAYEKFLNLLREKLDPTITNPAQAIAHVNALAMEAEAAAVKEIGDSMPAPTGGSFVPGYE